MKSFIPLISFLVVLAGNLFPAVSNAAKIENENFYHYGENVRGNIKNTFADENQENEIERELYHQKPPMKKNKGMNQFSLIESECEFKFVPQDEDQTTAPIDENGIRNDVTAWDEGDKFFKFCELSLHGYNHGYYGGMKTGKTTYVCLATKITSTDGDNDANFECSVTDELQHDKYKKYKMSHYKLDYAIKNNYFDMGWHYYNDMTQTGYYDTFIRSEGEMVGYLNSFKLATVGGVGGGIKAKGELRIVNGAVSYIHMYYVHAPYLSDGFPW